MASIWNSKARKWVQGRIDWEKKLDAFLPSDNVVWIHCASYGEFEQGRPLLEAIKESSPNAQIVLTFFSPSGYEELKEESLATFITYLPLDGPNNARIFIDKIKPTVAIFIKYEYWFFYVAELHRRTIPVFLASVNISTDSHILRYPFTIYYRKILRLYTHIFVQNQFTHYNLKSKFKIYNISATGDTRFDRVTEIADNFEPLPEIERFLDNRFCIVAGSTYPSDEVIIFKAYNVTRKDPVCWIIAPHEVTPERIDDIKSHFPVETILLSEIDSFKPKHKILVIDKIGLLSKLYKYGNIAYVGGGFEKGIHNVLEAAVYGKRVLFGEKFEKHQEAVDLLQYGSASYIRSNRELVSEIAATMVGGDAVKKREQISYAYVRSNTGATKKVIQYLKENAYI